MDDKNNIFSMFSSKEIPDIMKTVNKMVKDHQDQKLFRHETFKLLAEIKWEKFTSYMDAGFSREEAFKLVTNEDNLLKK